MMDPQTLGNVQRTSVAPRWDGSGTSGSKWFLDFRALERNRMYGLTDAMRRAVLLSLICASRSNPQMEMVNQYQYRYQDVLREVTEEVFTEGNDDVILEAFHTVKPSSLTPTAREFIHFVEQFLAFGRRVRDRITKDRLLDFIATMKVDGFLKDIIKEGTKVGLEFNYLEMIVFVTDDLMSRHKYPPNQVNPQQTGNKNGSGRVRGMEEVEEMDKTEDPEGHQDQEQADPELSIAEIQEICEAQPATTKEQQTARRETQKRRERTGNQEAGGQQNKQHTAPTPRAAGAGNQRKPETTGAHNGRNKNRAPSGSKENRATH